VLDIIITHLQVCICLQGTEILIPTNRISRYSTVAGT
jgi:hypothetical protein